MSTQIYILQDVDIQLTMPDGSHRVFTLQRPNGENAHWYRVLQQAPSGEASYKDPLRRRQRGHVDYYPEFHFSYGHHRMFTTLLLAAVNIQLITGWDDWHVDCKLANTEAVKNYGGGMAVAASVGSGRQANPVPSGSQELILIGRNPETWQAILNYFFYYLPGYMVVTWDSTEITFDSTEVRF